MPALNTPQFSWVKSRLPDKPQPVPPIFQPEVAAEAIYFAAYHKRRELTLGSHDQGRGRQYDRPGPAGRVPCQDGLPGAANRPAGKSHRKDNLWEALPGDQGAEAPSAANRVQTAQRYGW